MFKQSLLLATGFLAGAILTVAINPLAQQKGQEFHAEKGTCHQGQAPDGMFYQSPQVTNNQLNPGCSAFSLAGMFDDVRGWRIGYHDFGTIRARDNRFMVRDDEIRSPNRNCNPQTGSGCMGTMYGEGYMRGVSFSLTKRQPFYGVDLIGEAGVLFFESGFNAWAKIDHDGSVAFAREKSSAFNLPDLVLGGGVRWKDFYVMARKYWPMGHRSQSLTDFSVTEVTVGLAFGSF
jgi:hypothetical protein